MTIKDQNNTSEIQQSKEDGLYIALKFFYFFSFANIHCDYLRILGCTQDDINEINTCCSAFRKNIAHLNKREREKEEIKYINRIFNMIPENYTGILEQIDSIIEQHLNRTVGYSLAKQAQVFKEQHSKRINDYKIVLDYLKSTSDELNSFIHNKINRYSNLQSLNSLNRIK